MLSACLPNLSCRRVGSRALRRRCLPIIRCSFCPRLASDCAHLARFQPLCHLRFLTSLRHIEGWWGLGLSGRVDGDLGDVFYYRFDETRWPLVTIESPGGRDPESIDQDSFYAEFHRFRARDERAFFIHDLRGVQRMDAARRRRFVEWAKLHSPTARKLVVGYAVVVDSNLMAGVVTAVLWLMRPPAPMRVFSRPADAEAWLFSLDTELYPSAEAG